MVQISTNGNSGSNTVFIQSITQDSVGTLQIIDNKYIIII